eukprot:TRINITY_DN9119_c0_g1_i1.p1 TRINITY_DN9119_c0_g1~~TRINITY_DN9119_c0_g1_i1.p1  ORF type:complete len:1155 (+),score=322.34 TRINITY_DN9119_c0_g1_i1:118-3465(+)
MTTANGHATVGDAAQLTAWAVSHDPGDHKKLAQALADVLDGKTEALDLEELLLAACFDGKVDVVRLLLSKGASVKSRDAEGRTCLHQAVKGGHLELSEVLIAEGAAVNAQTVDGVTPLHHACSNASDADHLALVQLLVENGAQINRADHEGTTPLHQALTLASSAPMVEYLLRHGADPDARTSNGICPLHVVAFDGQLRAIEALVNAGANVNAQDPDGLTPLHHVCVSGNVEIARFLLAQPGIDLDIADTTESAAVHKACFHGRHEILLLLLDAGANLDYADGLSSPLHHAAFNGQTPCADLLLQRGAPVNCVDAERSSALHKAAFNGHVATVDLLAERGAELSCHDSEGSTPAHKAAFAGQHGALGALLNRGADAEAQDNDDGTPLHNAAFNGHWQCVQLLLASQANFNSSDHQGASPLHLSVLNGHVDVAGLLVAAGAQIDAEDDRGMTPLHHAVDHPSCVSFLLENGAQVDARDQTERTPLFYAVKSGSEESARLLVAKGADPHAVDKSAQTPYSIARPALQQILDRTTVEHASQADATVKETYKTAVKMFNQKPSKGVEFLVTNNVVNPDTFDADVAGFLHRSEGIDRTVFGDYISEPDKEKLLDEYLALQDFSNMDFDDALRYFLGKFRLPGEAQKIDRIVQRFAARYHALNPGVFSHEDTAYVLAFSLIMLNTDLHNASIKNKMTKAEFLRNNRGIDTGNDLPAEYMTSLYDKILNNEIKLDSEVSVFAKAEKMGWCRKQGGRIKTWKNRWFVLKDNCLYYFRTKEDEDPCGIIPLENLHVRPRPELKSGRYIFEVYSPSGEIKACKLENGQLVKGHHGSYLVSAPSAEEMEDWLLVIRNNISFNPLFELIKKRIDQHRTVEPRAVDFQEIHEACLKCSVCYKSLTAIKESYGNHAVVVDDAERSLRSFMLLDHAAKTQTLVLASAITEPQLTAPELCQPDASVAAVLGFDRTLEKLDAMMIKFLKREYAVRIYGHSLGGALALLLAERLAADNYDVARVLTFGQPKILSEKEASDIKALELNYTRVVDFTDPTPSSFPDRLHLGDEVVLFQENYYSVPDHPDESSKFPVQKVFGSNHIESYLRNVKLKLKGAVNIPFDENVSNSRKTA